MHQLVSNLFQRVKVVIPVSESWLQAIRSLLLATDSWREGEKEGENRRASILNSVEGREL